jgi:hypothetical protein
MDSNTFVRDFGPRGTVLRDRAAADRFIELIAQFPDAPMCWRSLLDAGKGALGNRDGTLEDHFDEFQAAQANGYGVFAVVNEGGHRDADMAVAEIAMTEAEIADDTAEGKRIVAQRKIGLGVKKHELERSLAGVLGDGAAKMAVEPNLI